MSLELRQLLKRSQAELDDLYTKSHQKPNVKELKPFYEDLINEYMPGQLRW